MKWPAPKAIVTKSAQVSFLITCLKETPSLTLTNNPTGSLTSSLTYSSYNAREEVGDSPAVVSHTGSVTWIPQAVTTTRCVQEDQDWICALRFASWTYDGSHVNVTWNGGPFVSVYRFVSSRWNIVENSAVRHVVIYECCSEPYIDLVFTLRFSRAVSSNSANGYLLANTFSYGTLIFVTIIGVIGLI